MTELKNDKVIVCDIDGVIADNLHRIPILYASTADYGSTEKWKRFSEACDKDKPILSIINLLNALMQCYDCVFLTGRPEYIRQKTEVWLNKHLLRKNYALLMRADDDFRSAAEMKPLLLESYYEKKDVLFLLDDDEKVINSFRQLGYIAFEAKLLSDSWMKVNNIPVLVKTEDTPDEHPKFYWERIANPMSDFRAEFIDMSVLADEKPKGPNQHIYNNTVRLNFEGDWYWIPKSEVDSFTSQKQSLEGFDYMDKPDDFDKFEESFAHYKTGGDKNIMPDFFKNKNYGYNI